MNMADEESQKRVRFDFDQTGLCGAEPSSHEQIKSSDKYLRQLYFQWHLSIGNYRYASPSPAKAIALKLL